LFSCSQRSPGTVLVVVIGREKTCVTQIEWRLKKAKGRLSRRAPVWRCETGARRGNWRHFFSTLLRIQNNSRPGPTTCRTSRRVPYEGLTRASRTITSLRSTNPSSGNCQRGQQKRASNVMESLDWVSAPVICGTAAGGFTLAFVRSIAKLFTSRSDTMPPHIAGAPFSLPQPRKSRPKSELRGRGSFMLV
jgi:hypothetical protein